MGMGSDLTTLNATAQPSADPATVGADHPSRSGWLDEAWTAALLLPVLLAFLPWTQEAAARGFAILSDAVPLWYQGALGVAFGWGFARPHLAQLWPGSSSSSARRS